MNSMKEDIKAFQKLQRLITLFQRINQLSWNADQAKKRYPLPEAMTKEEMKALTKIYLALGLDIEDIYQDWIKEYKEFQNEK